MKKLRDQKCVPCGGDEPTLIDEEIQDRKTQVPNWEIIEENGVKQLRRKFDFPNFTNALDFTNRIGEIAEEAGHHPAILTEWGKVTVKWWTHEIKGLHQNDFIMAAKTDVLYHDGKQK